MAKIPFKIKSNSLKSNQKQSRNLHSAIIHLFLRNRRLKWRVSPHQKHYKDYEMLRYP